MGHQRDSSLIEIDAEPYTGTHKISCPMLNPIQKPILFLLFKL